MFGKSSNMRQQSKKVLYQNLPQQHPSSWNFGKFSILTAGIMTLLLGICIVLGTSIVPTTIVGFDLKDRSIQYPVLPDTVTSYFNIILTTFIIILTVGIMNLINNSAHFTLSKIKWFLEVVASQILLSIYGMISVRVLVRGIKHYYGELRPSFITACDVNPNITLSLGSTTFVSAELAKETCLNEVDSYRWSFPSGHATQVIIYVLIV